ncbi:MAG: Maf family protein [Anaerolineae bacterium]|jgi:MAF protein|nr:Maf family protein [Anaerolineae bacterium]
MNAAIPTFLLASASPRRRELVQWTGWEVRAHAVDLDETRYEGEHPYDYVHRLAQEKAHAAVPFLEDGELILASDTIVALEEDIFGKPEDAEHAREILLHLRDKVHYVDTGIAILDPKTGQIEVDVCVVPVKMRAYSEPEIETYIATGDPFDKAGAYAIQHRGFHPVEEFQSCFASVMGLPLCHVIRLATKFGIPLPEDTPQTCQLNLSYVCPVHRDILSGINRL